VRIALLQRRDRESRTRSERSHLHTSRDQGEEKSRGRGGNRGGRREMRRASATKLSIKLTKDNGGGVGGLSYVTSREQIEKRGKHGDRFC